MSEQSRNWKDYLKGVPESHQLPIDFTRPKSLSGALGEKSLAMGEAESMAARMACDSLGVEPAVFHLASLAFLLWKYGAGETLVIGLPRASGTTPIRLDVDGRRSAADWLAYVGSRRETALGLPEAGAGELLEAAGVSAAASSDPTRQILFSYGAEASAPAIAGAELAFRVRDAGRIEVSVEYSPELFEAGSAAQLAGNYARAVSALARAGNAALDDLDLADAGARALIDAANATGRPGYLGRGFLELFRERVADSRGKTAIKTTLGDEIGYGELDELSDGIARAIAAAGGRPGDRIGVFMRRDRWLVPTLIGAFKAGCAYVPLDTHFPKDRLRGIAEDAGIRLIATTATLAAEARELSAEARIVAADEAAAPAAPDAVALPAPDPERIAYLLFTSGSTGKPKGVPIRHGSLANLLLSMKEIIAPSPDGTMLALATFTFDISLMEFFLPLICGARMLLVDDDTSSDNPALAEIIDREGVTLGLAAASRWVLLLDSGWKGSPRMTCITGGEALQPSLANALLDTGGPIWNMYGPTETTIVSSGELVERGRAATIGLPIANTGFYVLDPANRPLPPGIPGELAISGAGLSPGYLNRPELNADRFVEIGLGGGRVLVYKTGDLVQQRPGGEFRYIGRNDFQVKLRGLRIELGEIESALLRYPGVKEAACAVWARSEQDKRLVAYYRAEGAIDQGTLKAHLQKSLPEYMVPAHYVTMEEFPRTPSGKTDRKALPRPEAGEEAEVERKGPANEAQARILEIWKEILGRDSIGVDEGFFDLGGHSLLAAKLVREMNARLGGSWKLRDLFERPTIEAVEAVGKPGSAAGTSPEAGARAPGTSIGKRDPKEPPRLSPEQERLWFVHELDPDLPLYNLVAAYRIEGSCDPETLERALARTFDRHEAFRTRIEDRGSGPELVIADRTQALIRRVDLRGSPKDGAERELEADVRRLLRRATDYSRFPIVEAVVYLLGGEDIRLCLFVPHVISDGWSVEMLGAELREAYARVEAGLGEPPAAEIEYSDYAAWARRRKEERVGSGSLAAFWRGYLKGIPEVHDLPLDHPRPKKLSGKGGTVAFALSEEAGEKVKAACERHGITPYAFFLSALAYLIWRHGAGETVVVGTPYANREYEELQGIFGYFIKTIPLRFDVDGAKGAAEWFAYVKKQFLDALANSDLGMDEIVEATGAPRQANVNPIYQILFAYQSYMEKDRDGDGLRIRMFNIDRRISENELAFYMWDTGRIEGQIEYSSDLFDAESVEMMAANFQRAILALAEPGAGRLEDLDLVDERARELIDATNATGRPDYLGRTFVELFRERVADSRERTAVRTTLGDALTYGELDEASDGIARALAAAGACSGDRVGVYLRRDRWLLPTLIGAFKAGCAYVPLDPHFPPDRLTTIVEEAGIKIIASTRALAEAAERIGLGATVIRAEDCGGPGTIELPRPDPSLTAYVLFTSGSTGKPKGVPIRQDSLANLLLSVKEKPGLDRDGVMLALTTFTFDVSMEEFFLPLITGASLLLVDDDISLDSEKLVSLIMSEKITFIQATPSRWTMLLETGWTSGSGITFGAAGEALSPELARALVATGAETWNLYGPTETTVFSSGYRVKGDEPPSIGVPIANTGFYVLDRANRPLPPGIPGELAISGAGLSDGYLGRPDLTEGRFIEMRDGSGPLRVYKTGDLVQQRPDGGFRYFGRNDFQVKIRGFRIELGEIESVLLRYPGIKEAACAVWARSEHDKRLVAYYRAEGAVDQGALKAHLQKSLPEYMVPAYYVAMDEFPRTPSGKTDRKALPKPEVGEEAEVARKGPANEAQARILEIWKEILGRDSIGVDESFFDLGGHSLLATKLVREMNARLGGSWKLRDLFEHPTIEAIAACAGRKREAIPLLFSVSRKGTERPVFLVPGVYANDYSKEDDSAYERDFLRYFNNIVLIMDGKRPIYGLRPKGIYKGERFRTSIDAMAREYVREIKAVQPQGPYIVGGECLGGLIAHAIAARLVEDGEEVSTLLLLDTERLRLADEIKARFQDAKEELDKLKSGVRAALKSGGRDREQLAAWTGNMLLRCFPVTRSRREQRRFKFGPVFYTGILRRYRPERYEGHALVIINEEWHAVAPYVGWNTSLLPNLNYHVVPGDHLTRLNLENDTLKNCLQEHLR
jgi:amino acid adenylation domain-containing protein